MSEHNLVDPDGVRVCATRCKTCIFRPGNLMQLRSGRVKDMVDSALSADGAGSIVCHDTLDLPAQAICRGFWDGYRDQVQLLQLADRLGHVKEIPADADG